MKSVKITMEGGVIQDIDCPDGVRVIVRDYNTDNQELLSVMTPTQRQSEICSKHANINVEVMC